MIKKAFKLKDTLHHGTISKISEIDLSKGRGYKDFGKGFYLAYQKEQAVKMMNKKAREAKERAKGTTKENQKITKRLYSFKTNSEALNGLSVKIFDEADMEWLNFILNCRKVDGTPHSYDIVIGPTADDDTSYCINNYKEGVYGPVDSIRAKSILLSNLEVENYGTQVFIATKRGLSILKTMGEMTYK